MKRVIASVLMSGLVMASQEASSINKDIEQKVLNFIGKSAPKELAFSHVEPLGTVSIGHGWYGVAVEFEKSGQKSNEIFLTDGKFLAQNIIHMEEGRDFRTVAQESFSKPLSESFYQKRNLIYGDEASENRVVIFSNPLCPHCLNYMSVVHEHIKSHRNVAIYYYPVSLEELFPHAGSLIVETEIAKAALNDSSLDWKLYKALLNDSELYNLALSGKAEEVAKKVFGDYKNKMVLKEKNWEAAIAEDEKIINKLGIKGTPTVYVNGVIDTKLQKVFTLGLEVQNK